MTKPALPREMVALMAEVGEALGQVARAEPTTTLAALERGVLGVVRQALPRLLGVVVQANQRSLDPQFAQATVACPRCGHASRRHERARARRLQTICGPCRFERPWYVCRNRACGQGFSPTDQALGIAPYQQLSAELQGWLSAAGGRLDYREAAVSLAEWTGITVSPETVRQHTRQVGAALEAQQQARVAALATPRSAAEVQSEAPAPGHLVVETDGVFVRYREATGRAWHEVKLGVVGGWDGARLQAASYVAAREPAAVFGPRLAAEAARRGALDVVAWHGQRLGRGVAQLRHTLVLGDAASWIWHLAADYLAERDELIDFWHAVEHLSAVAVAVFGEADPTGRAWVSEQRTALRTEGVPAVLAALAALTPPTPEAAAVRRRETRYFRTHQHRMAYPVWEKHGWPLGSGAVEGAAKHLVQARLKRPGAAWSQPGAHAVLTVRCHLLSRLPDAA